MTPTPSEMHTGMPLSAPRERRGAAGMAWALLAIFIWSTTYVAARHLMLGQQIDPVSLAAIRFLIGGGLLCLIGAAVQRRAFFTLAAREWAYLALLGLCGAGFSVLLFFGQQSTTAINAAIINQLSPLFIMLFGLFIGERVSGGKVIGFAVALGGSLLVVLSRAGGDLRFTAEGVLGDVLVLLSALVWAIYAVMGKPILARVGGLKTTAWMMLFGGAELALLQVLLPGQAVLPRDLATWQVVLYMALFPSALAFLAWYAAMQRIALSLLNVTQYTHVIFTPILACVLLRERITWEIVAGSAVVLLGVSLVGGMFPRFATPRR